MIRYWAALRWIQYCIYVGGDGPATFIRVSTIWHGSASSVSLQQTVCDQLS